MLDMQQFEIIRKKHGGYASWAVWADVKDRPKSNMGDISHFESETVLNQLNPDVVMVGLNVSKWDSDAKPFENFHSDRGTTQDYKIRYAFKDSPYYGAYMTDFVKRHVQIDSNQTMKYLKEHPEAIGENLKIFREELQDLKTASPLILAFGGHAYKLLKDSLDRREYSKLIRLRHYSAWGGAERYKRGRLNRLTPSSPDDRKCPPVAHRK